MQIGDEVIYRGRRYAVVGFTPTSVQPYRVELHDAEMDTFEWVAWPADGPEPAALKSTRSDPEPD